MQLPLSFTRPFSRLPFRFLYSFVSANFELSKETNSTYTNQIQYPLPLTSSGVKASRFENSAQES